MWLRISDISVKQIDASHLTNPINTENPMVLNLFQRESSNAFFRIKNKGVFSQFIDVASGKVISKGHWSDPMHSFSKKALDTYPAQKGSFKVTVVGQLFLLAAVALFGYLSY